MEAAGSELNDLQGERIKADYRMADPDPEDWATATFLVDGARQHTGKIKGAFADKGRLPAIVQSIREYLKVRGG